MNRDDILRQMKMFFPVHNDAGPFDLAFWYGDDFCQVRVVEEETIRELADFTALSSADWYEWEKMFPDAKPEERRIRFALVVPTDTEVWDDRLIHQRGFEIWKWTGPVVPEVYVNSLITLSVWLEL